MRHPYEKFIRIELISMISAILIGIVALIKGYLILIFICFCLITVSLLAETIILWSTLQKAQGGKQFIRAFLLLILTIYLMLKW